MNQRALVTCSIIDNPPEIQFKLNSREISFILNLNFSRLILLIFFTKHNIMNIMLRFGMISRLKKLSTKEIFQDFRLRRIYDRSCILLRVHGVAYVSALP